MMRFNGLVNKLINTPNLSNIQIQVSAILLRGSKPIGNVWTNVERNYIKGHVCPAIHAEVNAISNYFGKDIRYSDKYGWIVSQNRKIDKKLNIMVVRMKNDNSLGNARPCYKCTLMLQNIGINKVYYSMDNKIYCEKAKDMISINVSSSWKQIESPSYGNIFDYYKSIMDKMPKVIKSNNTEMFLKNIMCEIFNSKYKMSNNNLIIYVDEYVIGTIIILF
jgi:deoxycytidylate deaminase